MEDKSNKQGIRFNITINEDVKEWYMQQAKECGMSASSMMAYVLTQHKKNEELKETCSRLSMMGNDNARMLDMFSKILEMEEDGRKEE